MDDGAEALGHTFGEHYNFVNRLKRKALEVGDAYAVIDELSQRVLKRMIFSK